jgi:hypothetical protein
VKQACNAVQTVALMWTQNAPFAPAEAIIAHQETCAVGRFVCIRKKFAAFRLVTRSVMVQVAVVD